MNGILGYLRLDEAPLASGKLAAMMAAMAYWEVDGSAAWSAGPVGLGCQYCFCTPEEKEKSIPYHDEERGWVLTAGAFLENREELISELGMSAEESRALRGEGSRGAPPRWLIFPLHQHLRSWAAGAES
jgi:hypothetical protein